jgi:hypothetical protein
MLANYNLRGQEAPDMSGAFFLVSIGEGEVLCYNSPSIITPEKKGSTIKHGR